MKPHYYLFLFVLLCSCAPLKKVIINGSYKPLAPDVEVASIDVTQPMPDSVLVLGTLLYQGSSADYKYNQLIYAAEKEARTMGGNLIKVTDMGLDNPCPLHITVLYRQNIKTVNQRVKAIADSLHRLKFGANPNYAVLYVYRPSGQGVLIGYKIRVNDSVVGKSRDNSVFKIRLYRQGATTIEAHTEASDNAKIDVKFGEEYYLKCGIKMGLLVGEPVIGIVPSWKGSLEYQQIEKENKADTPTKSTDN